MSVFMPQERFAGCSILSVTVGLGNRQAQRAPLARACNIRAERVPAVGRVRAAAEHGLPVAFLLTLVRPLPALATAWITRSVCSRTTNRLIKQDVRQCVAHRRKEHPDPRPSQSSAWKS
jgi:hypothetical protein